MELMERLPEFYTVVMDRRHYFEKMHYVKWLVDRKATGSPKELALRLGVSERSVYRILDDLRDLHQIKITYSRTANSYVSEVIKM